MPGLLASWQTAALLTTLGTWTQSALSTKQCQWLWLAKRVGPQRRQTRRVLVLMELEPTVSLGGLLQELCAQAEYQWTQRGQPWEWIVDPWGVVATDDCQWLLDVL